MNRREMLERVIDRREPWDFIVIGGGATGAGVALDAAARGYDVLLLERADFGSGTSSRSTKLIHGGVRYLRQGRIGLVVDALRERGLLRRNAPQLVHDLAVVLPCYSYWEKAYYGLGLTAYNLLAGRHRFGPSAVLNAHEVVKRLPTVRTEGLSGGVVYHDGQFDDARLLVQLLQTSVDYDAVVLNYAEVVGLSRRQSGAIEGVVFRDIESGKEVRASARVVINAAGPFCDGVRKLADPASTPLIAASRGSHVVLDRSFLPGEHALLVPETSDGRILFIIPWHGHTLVGTTDVALAEVSPNPHATDAEIEFILETAGRYLQRRPRREDVLSAFAGIRPLVRSRGGNTAKMSRDHLIRIECPGFITITGGKWTTYRLMAEQCVDRATELAGLKQHPCPTRELRLHGSLPQPEAFGDLAVYGSDAVAIQELLRADSALREPLHPVLPYRGAEVVWAVRTEMARTVEDVLARRTRALFLNVAAAVAMAPRVASLIARELGRDHVWEARQVRELTETARAYGLRT